MGNTCVERSSRWQAGDDFGRDDARRPDHGRSAVEAQHPGSDTAERPLLLRPATTINFTVDGWCSAFAVDSPGPIAVTGFCGVGRMRVLIVPGAGVRGYVEPAERALRNLGIDATLLPAPGQPGRPVELADYGRDLHRRLETAGPVDLLIGLSVGAQAAAVTAASAGSLVRRLMLVSPTVDPVARTRPRLLARWLAGGRVERSGMLAEQWPDWRRAGARRIYGLLQSAVNLGIETLLPVPAELTVVHAEWDLITGHSYAAALAADHGGRLILVPGATHSWPYRDADRFVDVVNQVMP
jgi:pimeloyl-ACP methyl ester carboxylesterase